MSTPKGDPFRSNYGTLTDRQKIDMADIKKQFEGVWDQLDILEQVYGKSRDLSIAKTHLQDSCMWAVRAVTKTDGQD